MKVLFLTYFESLIKFRKEIVADFCKNNNEVHVAVIYFNEQPSLDTINSQVTFHQILANRVGINPLKEIKFLFEIYMLLRRIYPDVFLTYSIKPNIYGGIASKIFSKIRFFPMITGLGFVFSNYDNSWRYTVIKKIVVVLYKIGFSNIKRVFFLNEDNKNVLINLNIIKDKDKAVLLNGEGVNLKKFPLVSLPNKAVFLMTARLLKDKGVIDYFKAAKIIKKKYQEVVFYLVGNADINVASLPRNTLDYYIKQGAVEYLGYQETVQCVLRKCSIFVLPSYHEGLPVSILEAMSMGRAIITTNTAGCKETVEDGENGFLVPIKNPEYLAYTMERYIKNNELFAKHGAYSRKLIENKFDRYKVNKVILDNVLN